MACGIVPVTTCTDLLKTGGYGRLPPYLHDLQKQMDKVGARTIDDFILDCRGQRAAAGGDPVQAGFLNTPIIVAETQADPRYRAAQNRAVPKKIDSHLVTFDCITCDKCIPVCPNDANFSYHTGEVRLTYRDVEVRPDGSVAPVGDEKRIRAGEGRPDRQLRRLLQPLRQLRHVLPRIRRPVFEEAELLRQPRRRSKPARRTTGSCWSDAGPTLTLTGRIGGRIYHLRAIRQRRRLSIRRWNRDACESSRRRRVLRSDHRRAAADAHVIDVGPLSRNRNAASRNHRSDARPRSQHTAAGDA